MGVPLIGLAGVVGVALLGATGYFAFTTNTPPLTSPTVSTASAEELEQALAERRRADALAADKRRLEEEARQKAQADADAKRQADEALEQTRQARQQAEQELAELKKRLDAQRRANVDQASRAAGEPAQRKAEQDAAALAEAEQRAAQKAVADAEAKRQADEALAKAEAQRQRAEQEARQKAEAEQAALRQASEDAQRKANQAESVKQAEQERLKAEIERAKAEAERQKAEAELKLRTEADAAEKTLRLDQLARERLQLALTSLGFDTRGSDGIFGPRTRDMISAWQKTRKEPPTGFLTAMQQQALAKEAAPALAKLDDANKAQEDAKAAKSTTPLAAAAVAASPVEARPATVAAPPSSAGSLSSKPTLIRDGIYRGGLGLFGRALSLELRMSNGIGIGTVTHTCGTAPISLTVDPAGNVTGELKAPISGGCSWASANITGRVEGGKLLLAVKGDQLNYQSRGEATLSLNGASGVTGAGPPALSSPDGLWRGTFKCDASVGARVTATPEFALPLEMQLVGGKGAWKSPNIAESTGYTMEMRVSVVGHEVQFSRFHQTVASGGLATPSVISGTYDGSTITATGRETTFGYRQCTLNLRRA